MRSASFSPPFVSSGAGFPCRGNLHIPRYFCCFLRAVYNPLGIMARMPLFRGLSEGAARLRTVRQAARAAYKSSRVLPLKPARSSTPWPGIGSKEIFLRPLFSIAGHDAAANEKEHCSDLIWPMPSSVISGLCDILSVIMIFTFNPFLLKSVPSHLCSGGSYS